MTTEEKSAMAWLATMAKTYGDDGVLQRMLAEPRLPAEPSKEALDAMDCVCALSTLQRKAIYYALYAHLTAPPKPKISILRALCIAKTLKGEGELGDALRLLASAYVERHGEPT